MNKEQKPSLNYIDFSKCFKYHRNRLGLSQSEAADRIGIQPAAVSHFETGIRRPSLNNFIKICNGFQINPSQLLRWNTRTQTDGDLSE